MTSPLIPEAAFAGPRRALARTLVHLCDYTPITSTTVDGVEVTTPGTTVVGVRCRYEASGTTSRDVRGLVTISVPTLTVAHDGVLAEGGVITNIRNSKGESLLAGPLTVDRRSDDDPLGLPLLRTYALHGADPGRA
jgi:hypothetical protein